MKKIWFIVFMLALILSTGCNRSASTPPPDYRATETKAAELGTVEASSTPLPTETVIPEATTTLEPTSTSSPTNTPAPTATIVIEGIPEDKPYTQAMYWFYSQGYDKELEIDPQFVDHRTTMSREEAALIYCDIIYGEAKLQKATGTFTDVDHAGKPELSACLEQLLRDGYISGCSVEPTRKYCPEKDLILGDMAVLHLRGLFNEPFSEEDGWSPPDEKYPNPWGNYYEATWSVPFGEYLIRNGHYDLGFGKFNAAQAASLAEISMAFYEVYSSLE